MYIPSAFQVTDQQVLADFVCKHAFGLLIVHGEDGYPACVSIPFTSVFNGKEGYLDFHVAEQNSICSAIAQMGKGTFVVQGAHGYISSSVYTHVNVPTYNYQAVHLSGEIDLLDAESLRKHLSDLVAYFEAGREMPLSIEQWPTALIDEAMKEIQGYRLMIKRVEAAFKLSQNRNETDFNLILDDLSRRGDETKPLELAMRELKCPMR